MKAGRWIVTTFGLALISLAFSAFIPDGINLIYGWFGRETISVDPILRVFTFLTSFLILLNIELVIWTRTRIEESYSDVETTLQTSIRQSTEETLRSEVFKLLLSVESEGDLPASEILPELKRILAVMNDIPEPLQRGYLVIFNREMDEVRKCLVNLSKGGVRADIRDHISISRRISRNSGDYTQIQRKAFRVPEEWTEDWIEFVSALPETGTECEYILLLSDDSLQENAEKVEEMKEFLEDRGFQFRICSLKAVRDSMGGRVPTSKVVEIFDGKYIKLSGLPEGQYRGGAEVELELKVLEEDRSLQRFVSCVQDSAENLQ